ncbi:DUF6084 family protein [soil metagenome]
MLTLDVGCSGVTAPSDAAVPILRFHLEVRESGETPVRILALRCQIRVEPGRRHHAEAAEATLQELFGAGDRWRDNLHPMPFASQDVVVGDFTGHTDLSLDVPVTYDFEVTSARYFRALEDGEVPFLLLFSGSAFAIHDGHLQVTPVSWATECRVRMPIAVWQQAVDTFYPATTFLRVHRDTLSDLEVVRRERCLPGWDATLQSLLESVRR